MGSQQDFVNFWPNFANAGPSALSPNSSQWRIPIQYEHEVYLQLTAGENANVEKTANQLYLEVIIPYIPTFLYIQPVPYSKMPSI